jgi:citronellol/citronellal dehydrogenase
MSLKGKTLFITGGSRGIGLAIGLKAAAEGANIAIAAKTVEPHPKLEGTIHTAAAEIAKAGGRALPLAVDVRDDMAVQAALDEAALKFGGIDIVVNNASAIQLTSATATDMRRYDLMQQINARGTFMVSKFAIPYLARAANPHILMLSPPLDMAEKWFASHTAYSMAAYHHRHRRDQEFARRRCHAAPIAQTGNRRRSCLSYFPEAENLYRELPDRRYVPGQ